MRIFGAFLLCVPLVSGFEWESHFSHDNQNDWPSTCKGKLQSPIPLSQNVAKCNSSISLKFSDAYVNLVNVTIANINYAVEVKVIERSPEHYIIVDNTQQYVFEALYIHWPAEHTIEGKRYPLEMEFVHYKKGYPSWEKASAIPDGIFVVSSLFDVSDSDNKMLDPITRVNAQISKKPFLYVPEIVNFGEYLPKEDHSFYRYEGSIPIPQCQEPIGWHVYTKPLPISDKQIKILSNIYSDNGKKTTHNERVLQDINNRAVFFKNEKKSC